MHESFLHYVWQLQYFDKKELRTSEGDPINIFESGTSNPDGGPDFLNSKIRIGSVDWVGNVEIHTKTSAWNEHRHNEDPAYNNVILHVVWEDDTPAIRSDGTTMPTLVLENRVENQLIRKYQDLLNNVSTIPCNKSFKGVDDLVKISMLDRALMQRLEAKSSQVLQLLDHVQGDWEEATYQLMARNFGFKINRDPFFQVSQSLSRKILLKHSDSLTQLEALLFGQAGFLDYKVNDEYMAELQGEYKPMASKYGLVPMKLEKSQWKFLRLRPANFPTIRLAQFSALFHAHKSFFAKIMEASNIEELRSIFSVETSEYWHRHYRFGRPTEQSLARLGDDSVNNIIINTVVPLLVAYGKHQDEQPFIDRAVFFLQKVPAEKNKIVRTWHEIEFEAKSAFDSQALIELNNNFCLKRRCLSCNIGVTLLKP